MILPVELRETANRTWLSATFVVQASRLPIHAPNVGSRDGSTTNSPNLAQSPNTLHGAGTGMNRRRIQFGLCTASLAIVLSTAAYSSRDSCRLDFAQYQGTEPPATGEDCRFVIVGDRTGSPEPGLMRQAFREINQLCPEFVISVGDLIDGYGDDPATIHQLWNEFDGEVAALKSPFVYLPGNHDIWSATSRGIYEARYGPTYRSFNYRGLHFISLDTEETDAQGRPAKRISGTQLAWLRDDLALYRDARQILIFMHRPIWEQGSLDAVYPLLPVGRVHIFAGHDHRYSLEYINGIPHVIVSAVAGVMTERESVESGNFRHYVFATVRGGSLQLALVRLGGVLCPDVTLKQGERP
jgi:hypothetical protein